MMVETVLSRSVRLICASGLAIGMQAAVAQTAPDAPIQRVEITGSSIKRITAEGALPVQTLSHLQIEQSGASSVADLIATLPSMQGFTPSPMSVKGGGGGIQTASIHAIGEGYTLVLLNGRRLAPATSGSTVNLASIPLAAVERVEILTDGANTLYGSDAIAGVVNFILKKNQTDLIVEGTFNSPKSSGGQSSNVSISKGWGEMDKDGFNVLVSAAHDESRALCQGPRLLQERRDPVHGQRQAIQSVPAELELDSGQRHRQVQRRDRHRHQQIVRPELHGNRQVQRPQPVQRRQPLPVRLCGHRAGHAWPETRFPVRFAELQDQQRDHLLR